MDIEKMVREAFNSYHKSIVMIVKRTAGRCYVGTGFIIGRKETSYLMMTCSHCVTLASNPSDLKLSVRIPMKTKEYEGKVLYKDEAADLAIVQVMNVPKEEDCPVLEFGILGATSANTPIVELGYLLYSSDSLNLEPAASPGTIITPLYQNGQIGMEDVVIASSSKHGSSGSAVILGSKVIGVAYGGPLLGQTMHARSSNTVGVVMKNWLNIEPNNNITIGEMIDIMLQNI